MFRIFLFSAIFLFSIIFAAPVFAGDVVVNEFLVAPSSSQWVELYNKGASSINISGWFIDDNGGSEKYTIPNETSIEAGEFKVFGSSSFNFNTASADEIKLFNGSTVEDSYSYSESPGENYSFGRKPNGGDWVVFNTPTKGSSNNDSSPVPSPTPTPTPSPDPIPSPSPTPTAAPTPTPSATPTPLKSPSPKPKASPSPEVLSEATYEAQSAEEPSPSPSPVPKKNSQTKVAAIVTGSGVFLIGLSAVFYLLYRRLEKSDAQGKKDDQGEQGGSEL